MAQIRKFNFLDGHRVKCDFDTIKGFIDYSVEVIFSEIQRKKGLDID